MTQAIPIEKRPRIGLSRRRNVAVTDQTLDAERRQQIKQILKQGPKCCVLGIREGLLITPFEFYADGKIIAARTALPIRITGVPRASENVDELN